MMGDKEGDTWSRLRFGFGSAALKANVRPLSSSSNNGEWQMSFIL